jgi:stearoyl-CoA desaturase (delta-9 desaturase)
LKTEFDRILTSNRLDDSVNSRILSHLFVEDPVSTLWIALISFFAAYFINMFYVTVLYHRGLAHGAIRLKPWTRRFTVLTGNWVTGIDPKAWACMHRLHHRFSDTEEDPHSPWNAGGVLGVMLSQLRSYERALRALNKNREPFASVVRDLDFPVSWTNRKRVWWLPYVLHAGIGVGLSALFGSWWIGGAYWLGMMSHPVQGWMVNALAHKFGYRNFDNDDQSRNNTFVAWFVFGEGYQNNHHAFPEAAKFAMRPFEFDPGYLMVKLAQALRLVEVPSTRRESRLAHV